MTENETEIETEDKIENVKKPKIGLFGRIKKGLSKTRTNIVTKVSRVVKPGRKVDDDLLEDLEEIFITSDMGVNTTMKMLDEIKRDAKKQRLETSEEIMECIKQKLIELLTVEEEPKEISEKPHIILVVGVNGAGKTTTIGKLSAKFKESGKNVLVAAGDTFRAAAIEQLEVWSSRAGVDIVKHHNGADPSAVVFDSIKAAQSRGVDILIIDTAGRLHTKSNLMEGLKKINRIIGRECPGAPHETLLVLDAGLGQNTIAQAKEFNNITPVSGLILTKLDGTSKGGVIVNVVDSLKIPIRYIGTGEGVEDLNKFEPEMFVDALLG